jgi:hypothetical protein
MLTKSEAYVIMGDKPKSRSELNLIIKALSLHPWLNTKEERERLEAAIICRVNPNPKWSR